MKQKLAFVAAAVAISLGLDAQVRPSLMGLIGQTVSGTVISVADGDTVRVRMDGTGWAVRVRLEGIDAPETGEPFSGQARNATRVMLFDKKVQVKATDVDRYDRLVARISVEGRDSSVTLVESGLACHYTRYSSDRALATAQLAARTAGRGFWAANAPKPGCALRLTARPSAPPQA